jgi:hypothetical protein
MDPLASAPGGSGDERKARHEPTTSSGDGRSDGAAPHSRAIEPGGSSDVWRGSDNMDEPVPVVKSIFSPGAGAMAWIGPVRRQ